MITFSPSQRAKRLALQQARRICSFTRQPSILAAASDTARLQRAPSLSRTGCCRVARLNPGPRAAAAEVRCRKPLTRGLRRRDLKTLSRLRVGMTRTAEATAPSGRRYLPSFPARAAFVDSDKIHFLVVPSSWTAGWPGPCSVSSRRRHQEHMRAVGPRYAPTRMRRANHATPSEGRRGRACETPSSPQPPPPDFHRLAISDWAATGRII